MEDKLEGLLTKGHSRPGSSPRKNPRFTTRLLLGMLGGILDWYREGRPYVA